MGIGKRIKEARKSKGLTQRELGKIVGTTASAITNYENETSHPKGPVLCALLSALEVDANYLFQDYADSINLDYAATPWEMTHIIKKYRNLDEHGKKIVNFVLEELNSIDKTEENDIIHMDLYDFQTAEDIATPLEGEYRTLIQVPDTPINRNADFCVRISDDSMEPEYKNGSIVMVKKCQIHLGEVGLFVLNGKSYIKELGKGKLLSYNNNYPPIALENYNSIFVAGKVIGKL